MSAFQVTQHYKKTRRFLDRGSGAGTKWGGGGGGGGVSTFERNWHTLHTIFTESLKELVTVVVVNNAANGGR